MKRKLQSLTSVGTFTRNTAAEYKFVKVWRSARAQRAFESNSNVGAPGQWCRDKGFIVTWHTTRETADASKCKWDSNAELVGIFPVDA